MKNIILISKTVNNLTLPVCYLDNENQGIILNTLFGTARKLGYTKITINADRTIVYGYRDGEVAMFSYMPIRHFSDIYHK